MRPSHGSLPPTTLTRSYLQPQQTALAEAENIEWDLATMHIPNARPVGISANVGSTGKGILIGMLSAFGSAALIAIILAVVYFFRYTQQGRIFLDRIGRPGEYDDEQQFAKEEAEALEEMDDIQRMEYLRAKGMSSGLATCAIEVMP